MAIRFLHMHVIQTSRRRVHSLKRIFSSNNHVLTWSDFLRHGQEHSQSKPEFVIRKRATRTRTLFKHFRDVFQDSLRRFEVHPHFVFQIGHESLRVSPARDHVHSVRRLVMFLTLAARVPARLFFEILFVLKFITASANPPVYSSWCVHIADSAHRLLERRWPSLNEPFWLQGGCLFQGTVN